MGATDPTPKAAPDLDDMLRRAREHAAAGRLDEASELCRSVLDQHPGSGQAHFGLAQIAVGRGRADEAVAHFQDAIAADPGVAVFHAVLADLEQRRGRPAEALASAERALALDPRNLTASCMQAVSHLSMNRIEEAAAAATRAVEIAPDDANTGLIMARVDLRAGRVEEARTRIERILADPGLKPFLRCVALRDVGETLDKMGAWDAAFDAFAQCGTMRLASPEARRIDPDLAATIVSRYRSGTTRELLTRWTADDLADGRPAPAFLVGFPRSGTTMTEQVLAAHPGLVTSDEQDFLGFVRGELRKLIRDVEAEDVPRLLARLDLEQVRALRRVYREQIHEALGPAPDGGRHVDKLPLNLVHLPLVCTLFPDAPVIVALRDPRDVCLSCLMQWFALNPGMRNFLTLEGTAGYYAQVMDLWLHVRDMLPLPFVEIRYEDTVHDLEIQARRLLDLLGLAWDPGVLEFHEKARERYIRTPSFAAVTEKVHTRAVGRWRNYETHLAPVMEVLRPFVEAFGYE